MSHLYQISLPCVIGHLMCHRRLPTTDGGGGGGGQKVLSRPSADSFAVGQRQKGQKKGQNYEQSASRENKPPLKDAIRAERETGNSPKNIFFQIV
jgi:hypothetical protein